ncbi:hypothetical protein [Streptomyces sp. NBRC 109706]|uniref:hypothetical protein n=1 Tax=Streptomyces sp. NBRC 109706 TaxID=1550035 RepID=UPI000786282C|nr:hypothetical protein [Streptomyces sp. NBRC 109706]
MADGLEYIPESMRAGGQGSYAASDAAEDAHTYLRTVSASGSSFGGADGFANAVNETRDTQSRGVENAVEGRSALGDIGYQTASYGEDMDAASQSAVLRGVAQNSRSGEFIRIADAI